MSLRGDVMREVNTEPATMPIALPVPPAAKSHSQRYRDLAGLEFRESMKLEGRLLVQAARTPEDEEQKRLGRNETAHFIATLLTFGLWGPVWLYVLVRNTRRHGRTAQGRLTTSHVRSERARLQDEQRARREEVTRAMRAESAERWRALGRTLTFRRPQA